MYKIFLIMFICGLSFNALANCYQINNSDAKNKCLATTKKDATYCYQIKSMDSKSFCLAETKKDKAYCWQIKSNDLKQECLSMF